MGTTDSRFYLLLVVTLTSSGVWRQNDSPLMTWHHTSISQLVQRLTHGQTEPYIQTYIQNLRTLVLQDVTSMSPLMFTEIYWKFIWLWNKSIRTDRTRIRSPVWITRYNLSIVSRATVGAEWCSGHEARTRPSSVGLREREGALSRALSHGPRWPHRPSRWIKQDE